MMNYTTEIFIHNIVSFDFAILSKQFGIIGKSLSLDVAFEGSKKQNGMVVDFAFAKDIVKSVVTKFDHKLIVMREHVKFENKLNMIVAETFKTNSFFAMFARNSWIQILTTRIVKSLESGDFLKFEQFLANLIFNEMPKNISHVRVKLNENQTEPSRFWYTHTLCKHEGQCQRFHGHSAHVNVYQNMEFDYELSHSIAKNLNGLYIVAKQNLRPLYDSMQLKQIKKYCLSKKMFENLKDHLHAIQYRGSQGSVAIVLSKNHMLILENESTIENIAEYVRAQIPLKNVKICVYEGLNKGAVVS